MGFSVTSREFTGTISTPCTLDQHCIAGLFRRHICPSGVARLSTANKWLLQVCQGWLGHTTHRRADYLGGYHFNDKWAHFRGIHEFHHPVFSKIRGRHYLGHRKNAVMRCYGPIKFIESLCCGCCLCPGVGNPLIFCGFTKLPHSITDAACRIFWNQCSAAAQQEDFQQAFKTALKLCLSRALRMAD